MGTKFLSFKQYANILQYTIKICGGNLQVQIIILYESQLIFSPNSRFADPAVNFPGFTGYVLFSVSNPGCFFRGFGTGCGGRHRRPLADILQV